MNLIEDLMAEHDLSSEAYEELVGAITAVVGKYGAETVKAVTELVEDQLAALPCVAPQGWAVAETSVEGGVVPVITEQLGCDCSNPNCAFKRS